MHDLEVSDMRVLRRIVGVNRREQSELCKKQKFNLTIFRKNKCARINELIILKRI